MRTFRDLTRGESGCRGAELREKVRAMPWGPLESYRGPASGVFQGLGRPWASMAT
jgi:hypothetical protein